MIFYLKASHLYTVFNKNNANVNQFILMSQAGKAYAHSVNSITCKMVTEMIHSVYVQKT